jgi:5-methyltetrahydrofolate--homocysteine methyltransferase
VACIVNLATAAGPDDVLVAKANCGIPRYVDGAIQFDGTPELMARYARMAFDAGARIIGGCCGTTPEHLRAMKQALDSHTKGERPDATAISQLGTISSGAQAQLQGRLDRLSGAAPGAAGRRPASQRRGARPRSPE